MRSVEIKGPNKFDQQWVDAVFTLENSDGQTYNQFVSFPTTASQSYLFGSKKSLREYNDLDRFVKGIGLSLNYETAIHEIQEWFADLDSTFVGQTITMRLGYRQSYVKYLGKDGESSQYGIVDKDGKAINSLIFSGWEAAEAYADAEKIKLQKFIRCLETLPGKPQAPKKDVVKFDLPF